MERIIEILRKIEQPLFFSSREGYKHLPLVKDLETTISTLLEKLFQELPSASIDAKTRIDAGPFLRNFQDLFKGYDAIPLEQKKEVLEKSLLLCAELRQRLASLLPHCAHSNQHWILPRIPRNEDINDAINFELKP